MIVEGGGALGTGADQSSCCMPAASSTTRRVVDNCMAAINLVIASGRHRPRRLRIMRMITGQGNGQGGREQGQKCDQLPGNRDITNPEHRKYIAGVWGVARRVDPWKRDCRGSTRQRQFTTGKIKGLISICFNPTVSLPDANFVREALSKLEFYTSTSTSSCQRRLVTPTSCLPGSLMEEDEGTTTNVEGRVILHRKAVSPPARSARRLEDLLRSRDASGNGDEVQLLVAEGHVQ